jgi:hypothetical protein
MHSSKVFSPRRAGINVPASAITKQGRDCGCSEAKKSHCRQPNGAQDSDAYEGKPRFGSSFWQITEHEASTGLFGGQLVGPGRVVVMSARVTSGKAHGHPSPLLTLTLRESQTELQRSEMLTIARDIHLG